MDKPETTFTEVKLSQHAFNVVKQSFNYIVENHHLVDWAMQAFPHLNEVKAITNKIESVAVDNTGSKVLIPMNRDEWIDYRSLVEYLGSVLPEDWTSERITLERLSFEYADWEATEPDSRKLPQDKASAKTQLIAASIETHKVTLNKLAKQ